MDSAGWTVLIAALTLFTVVVAAAWTILQSQITSMDRVIHREMAAMENSQRLKDDCQDEDFESIRHELERREVELKQKIATIDDELTRRRQEFVHVDAFSEFQKSADDRWHTQAQINDRAIDSYLSVKAWEAWRGERDRLIMSLQQQMDAMTKRDG